MEYLLVIASLTVPIWLNLKASRLVLGDDFSERSKKVGQFLLIWLIPILGAVLVLVIHRPTEMASRQYREVIDPGEDFAQSGRSSKILRETLDSDE